MKKLVLLVCLFLFTLNSSTAVVAQKTGDRLTDAEVRLCDSHFNQSVSLIYLDRNGQKKCQVFE